MNANDWIKVSPESMPELLEPVMAWSNNSFHKVILTNMKVFEESEDGFQEITRLGWRLIMGGMYIELNHVTHWMPIVPPDGVSAEERSDAITIR